MGATRGEHKKIIDGPISDGLPSIIAAAHELKSPLALIRQLSLSLESGDMKLSDQKRMLQQISLTTERALRLTNDLTRSIKLSDALFVLEPINPQQLCEDIKSELTPLFEAHGRGINLIPRIHPLLLIANRDLLRRIIINFGDNALHYAGGDSPVTIKIELINAGKVVRIGVRDYGPSLSINTIDSLKDKLVDVSNLINTRPQSSGLGLYISSQFADAMNGRIGIIRHRDGSTFYVDLQASRQLSLI